MSRISNIEIICWHPPEGVAHWMFHSVCLTSGLQSREIITPPKLDLWETAVSRLCHSDKMFYCLGWISFLAEGPCVQAGGWMRGCRLRGGRETIRRVLYGNRSWKHKRQILGTHPLISYRLPGLDCASTPPWIRCVSLLVFLKYVWEISSLTQMSKTLFHSLFWVNLILNPVSYSSGKTFIFSHRRALPFPRHVQRSGRCKLQQQEGTGDGSWTISW